ncbi:ABC transporter permease [Prescottella subtropica]|uniref:ABC transporter permease n=1 Tax=Prescottella subtropica TaxID=2545757 RepID=UPI0010F5FCC8|nr:ABC transporter permease [Prescottella subtropica]
MTGRTAPPRRDLALWTGAGLAVLVVAVAALGPLVVSVDPNLPDYGAKLRPPSAEHWLGTDQYGRDQAARLAVGLRRSLLSALAVLAGSMTVSLLVGVFAALSGRWVDGVLSRIVDILLAVPSLVLALALVGVLGPGYVNLLLALVVSSWAADARLARALTLEVLHRPYITAARLSGSGTVRIALRHIVPAVLPRLSIVATLRLGAVVVSLAGLSFLGLGVQQPDAELGAMLGDARKFLTAAPWLLIVPATAILAMTAAANLIADSLHRRHTPEGRR